MTESSGQEPETNDTGFWMLCRDWARARGLSVPLYPCSFPSSSLLYSLSNPRTRRTCFKDEPGLCSLAIAASHRSNPCRSLELPAKPPFWCVSSTFQRVPSEAGAFILFLQSFSLSLLICLLHCLHLSPAGISLILWHHMTKTVNFKAVY